MSCAVARDSLSHNQMYYDRGYDEQFHSSVRDGNFGQRPSLLAEGESLHCNWSRAKESPTSPRILGKATTKNSSAAR